MARWRTQGSAMFAELVSEYLMRHRDVIPRTALRYAIE